MDRILRYEKFGLKPKTPFVLEAEVIKPIRQRMRYKDWRLIEEDPLGFAQPVPFDELTPIDFGRSVKWSDVVLDSEMLVTEGMTRGLAKEGYQPPKPNVLTKRGEVGDILRQLQSYNVDLVAAQKANDGKSTEKTLARRRAYLGQVSKRISDGNHQMLVELYDEGMVVDKNVDGMKDSTPIFANSFHALHLLVGTDKKFLVGLNGGPTWKEVELPTFYEEMPLPLFHLSTPVLSTLKHVGKPESVALPRKVISPWDIPRIKIPETTGLIEQHMEEAFYHPHFSMIPGLIPIELRNAADITRLSVMESNGYIFASGETRYGDLGMCMSLDDLSGISTDLLPTLITGAERPGEVMNNSRFASLVVKIYKDMVCGREITDNRFRKIGVPKSPTLERSGSQPIPEPRYRLIVPEVRSDDQPRLQRKDYDGPPRPMKPHWVGRAFRRRQGVKGMTDKQRRDVQTWRLAHRGIRVPIPRKGETVVLPHCRPEGAEAQIQNSPTFIIDLNQERAVGDVLDPEQTFDQEEAFYGSTES